VNLYRYTGNNPLNYLDPWGLRPESTMQLPWWIELPAGILWEPADWLLTGRDWVQGDFRWWDLFGLLPVASHGTIRGAEEAYRSLRSAETWGNPKILQPHFRKHGADFGAQSADDYAGQASDFFQRAQREGLPTKIDPDGTVRVYDPSTNTFGSYNPDGTTKTFFKPSEGASYWERQQGNDPWMP
jgi:hypothetical protein